MIELLLLGTGGGPTPKPGRGSTAQALIIDGVTYVVDCGSGVGPALVKAGVSLGSLGGVFITHHHFDHVADFGALFVQAWSALDHPVPLVAPPPIADMTQFYLQLFAEDFAQRVTGEGRMALSDLIAVSQFSGPGEVYNDERVSVSACLARHPPVQHAYAYKFQVQGRTIVFSGDTARNEELIAFAQGADVLVHEAVYASALGTAMSSYNAPGLLDRMARAHTLVDAAAEVAAAAGVGRLVLSPLAPATGVSDDEWLKAALSGFDGEIIIGRDGLRIALD